MLHDEVEVAVVFDRVAGQGGFILESAVDVTNQKFFTTDLTDLLIFLGSS